jgi:hypothetical protein
MKQLRLDGPLHRFNTGRHYAQDGQQIVWAFVRDEEDATYIGFLDKSRMIEGLITVHFGNRDLVDDGWVLRAYDDRHWAGCYQLWNLFSSDVAKEV